MNGLWGAGLLAATVLLTAWAFGAYRRPNPKAWTNSEAIATAIALVITAGIGFSITYIVAFAAELWLLVAGLGTLGQSLAGAGIVTALALAWLLVRPRGRKTEEPEAPIMPNRPKDRRPRGPVGPVKTSGAGRMRRAA